MADVPRAERKARPLNTMKVLKREQVGSHIVRLTLGGPDIVNFIEKKATDRYIKILFAKPELQLEMPYNMYELREKLPLEDLPVRRTYTVRRSDIEAGTIEVDFVTHGEQGLAGPWAQRAQIGEQVCFAGPGGLYAPSPEFDFHLLVGDETSIPAISASLEGMEPDMVGQVVLEVAGPEDELELTAPQGVQIRWVHRGGPFTPQNTVLESVVRSLPWPQGRVQVFAHAEREVTKGLRHYFYDERKVPRREMSISAYWAYGRAEDAFQAEKQTPQGWIFEGGPLKK